MRGEEALKKLRDVGFNCQQCGNCCLQLGHTNLELSKDETERWRESQKLVPSNFGYLELEDFIYYIQETGLADLWFHPDTGDELFRCPFLRKKKSQYKCLIYKLRPDACKYFPLDRNTGETNMNASDICPEVRRLTGLHSSVIHDRQ